MMRSVDTKGLRLEDAMRLRSAELWLEVDKPFQAMRELSQLSETALRHPCVVRMLEILVHLISELPQAEECRRTAA